MYRVSSLKATENVLRLSVAFERQTVPQAWTTG